MDNDPYLHSHSSRLQQVLLSDMELGTWEADDSEWGGAGREGGKGDDGKGFDEDEEADMDGREHEDTAGSCSGASRTPEPPPGSATAAAATEGMPVNETEGDKGRCHVESCAAGSDDAAGAAAAGGGGSGRGGHRRLKAAYWYECRCGDRFWLPEREFEAVQESIAVPCRSV